ncbi:hypothetical protein Tco_1141107 [Tanacetum coccineum]
MYDHLSYYHIKRDSIIPLGQKNTLAEYMILSGADNRPPMLDKDLYDSWKSRMELYMQNREHGRMILESVENGPLIWHTVEENGVTKTKKYAKLSAAEKIQANCDMKETNIILQGLPADIYSLMNHHIVRECKLYDAFNKFNHIKGESLHKYYLRFTQLINDMNIYTMKMEQFQVNTKFLNNLPPKWSKFVTDVKLVKDLHTTKFDQLHAYLNQHKLHANEVRLLRECNKDPLAFVANQQMTPPYFNTYQSSYNNPQLQQQFPPSQYGLIHPTQHYSSITTSIQSFIRSTIISISVSNESSNLICFAVLVFSPGDDPIACLSKAMAFLIAVASLSYSGTGYKNNATSCGETMQVDKQRLLNATTVKVKDIWLGNALILSDQGMQHGIRKNVELENSVAKLLLENEHLCNEINHMKQVFKEQFDSIKKPRVHTKEQSDSLIDRLNLKSAKNEDLKAQIQDKVFLITSLKDDLRKVKRKEIVDIAAQIPSANTIVLGMFKLDLEPLALRLLQNMEAHIDYLKYTQEQADILRGIVEQAKVKQPLDNELDFACKHAQ